MAEGPESTEEPLSGPAIPVGALVRRLLALAWDHKLVALPAIGATIAFQLLTLVSLRGQGLVIDLVRRRLDDSAPPVNWPLGVAAPESWSFGTTVGVVVGLVLMASVLAGAARFLTRYADEFFVQACVVDLRRRLYQRLQRLGFGFFDRTDTGQIINRITGDSQEVRFFIQGVMIRSGIALITLAIFLFFMLRESVWLTLACLVIYPLQVLVMVRYSRVTKPLFLAQSKLVDGLVKALQESIAGVRVIRVFGREATQAEAFDARAARARDQRMSIARHQSVHTPFVQASNILGQAVLLGLGGWLVMKGRADGGIALGTLWIFRGLLDRLAAQADAIVSIIGETPEALAGAERVFKLLDEPVEITSRPGAELPRLPSGEPGLAGAVEFRNVTFGYRPDRPVLRDVSFRAEPGETIAIVGPTGSGKSTLLSLIPRFYDPQAGSVLIDGIDARELPVDELRRAVGVVFQEPFLFSHSIGANIAFGRPGASEEEIRAAAAGAAATEFIEQLPGAFGTIIGERGVSLSGGQRQRLTIARALLTHPSILVLDDATGSVDALTESDIQRSLDASMIGRTTFVVAHRLSTLRRADRVIVLDKGRIVDVGTHHELMNRPGHYRAAALIQLALDEAGEQGHGGARRGAAS